MTSLVARASLGLSKVMRSMGAAMDSVGRSMEVTKYKEKLVPSTRFVAVDGMAPVISSQCFVAPSASVIGNVSIGKSCSVWYGATVRGDVNFVTIGDGTSIGDRAVVHVAKIQGDFPTVIGKNVTIKAGALIHAATLQDGVTVGEMAQVLDGAVVNANAVIAPASIVTPGTKVGEGELWAGAPAKKVRALTPEEISSIPVNAMEVATLAMHHATENAKDYKQILEEENAADVEEFLDPSVPRAPGRDEADVLGQGHPGRIFRSTLSHPEEAFKQQQQQQDQGKQ